MSLWARGAQDMQPLRSQNVSRELFEAGRERQAGNPLGALQSTVESLPPEVDDSLPLDMGVGPDMGVNLTAFR